MAVYNPHGLEVWVKPENGSKPVRIGRKWEQAQDGIALPQLRPGAVFKSVDGVDLHVHKDGSIGLDIGVSPIKGAGQLIKGGWYDQPTKEMGRTWDALFQRSRPKRPKKTEKPKKRNAPRATGGEGPIQYNPNRDFMNDLFAHGIDVGGSNVGGIARGYGIGRDLN